jgi:hypothetical protein
MRLSNFSNWEPRIKESLLSGRSYAVLSGSLEVFCSDFIEGEKVLRSQ